MFSLSKSTKFYWISISIIMILLMSLPLVITEAKEKEMLEKNGLKVTIFLFSGRQNPVYLLDDKDVINQLKTLIDASRVNERFEKTTVIPSILGYNGILVENPANFPGFPAHLAVYKGNIEIKNERKKFLIDEDNAIENLLINQASEKGAIDEKAIKFIKSD